MEVLSEHLCQGWLEGYLLTGRHGLFNCYEAFIHIIDSMFNQHAKWLKVTRDIPWRRPIPSLNYLLSSHVWRQDHNGFSHQDPGFIDHVVNKRAEIIRVYLPPDANCLLSVADHCLRSYDYVNVIVAGKQPSLDYLTMDEAITHCTRGLGIWDWASTGGDEEPDVVLACAGDIPTLETVSAAALLREHLPDLKVRVVNVVDLMRLQPRVRAPARAARRRVRRALHHRPAGDLRLPRLPVADPPPHLPAPQPRRPPRARLQGGGHHHDALRHGDAQRHGPLPPRDGRDRPRAGARHPRGAAAPADGRPAPGHRAYTREVGDDPPDVRDWTWPADGDQRDGEPRARRTSLSPRVRVLVVNAGSSSLKLRLLAEDDAPLGERELPAPRAEIDVDEVREAVSAGLGAADAVGHRIVHGGERFRSARPSRRRRGRTRCASSPPSRRFTSPSRSRALDAVSSALPDTPAVACFDTAFHATIPPAAQHVRAARCLARALAPPALRLPRPLACLGSPARSRAGGPGGRRACGS